MRTRSHRPVPDVKVEPDPETGRHIQHTAAPEPVVHVAHGGGFVYIGSVAGRLIHFTLFSVPNNLNEY